jgi:hypothetical protein
MAQARHWGIGYGFTRMDTDIPPFFLRFRILLGKKLWGYSVCQVVQQESQIVFGITCKRRGFYQAGGALKVMGKGGNRRDRSMTDLTLQPQPCP